MTPQERDLINTLLARLKNVSGQPKDPEAEALIRQAMAEQPDMPYYLVQTVLIQDLSLHNAQYQIADLQRQLAEAQRQAAAPAPTSFLGGLFGRSQPEPPANPAPGPWSRSPQVAAAPPVPPQPMAQPAAPPYGQQAYPQAGYGQTGGPGGAGGMFGGMGGAGGGFLRSAAATAAGIAGGALLFQGIQSLFGHQASAGILGNQAGLTPGLGESVVNNYYGSDAGAGWSDQNNQDFSSAGYDPNQDFSSGDQDFSSNQDFSSDQDFSSGDFDSNQC